jgi:hypothetical protein
VVVLGRRTQLRELIARGYEFQRREGEYAELPSVQVVGIDAETGERLAATDPRSGKPPRWVRVELLRALVAACLKQEELPSRVSPDRRFPPGSQYACDIPPKEPGDSLI